MSRTSRRARRLATRPSGLARLSGLGLALGLVAVAGLVAVQRPVLLDPTGAIAVPSASAPTSTAAAPPSAPTGGPIVADRSLGSPTAPLTLTVWSDYQCPACGALARTILPRFIAEFVDTGRVRLEYRDFAFLGQESLDAAVGAHCADDAGRFWPYHELVFANQQGENLGAFAPDRLAAIAAAAGLDEAAFRACVADPSLVQVVARETAQGRDLGIQATPTLVLAGGQLRGVPSWEDLVAWVESAEAGR